MSLLKLSVVLLITLSVSGDLAEARIYKPCELVDDLRDRFQVPEDQIPTWTCLAYYESRYDTRKRSPANSNGFRAHGIFQITDQAWCYPPGKGCNINCAALRTNDIAESVKCARTIWEEWQRIYKNGFKAWDMYKFCDTPKKVNKFVEGCSATLS